MKLLKKKDLVEIQVVPKLRKGEKRKLIPDSKKPDQGVVLKKGTHQLTVIIHEGDKPNKITEAGVHVLGVHKLGKVGDKFSSVKITVVKVRKGKRGAPTTVTKVIKVPQSATFKDLKNLLKKLLKFVKKLSVELKVKSDVKIRLNVKGCVGKAALKTTTVARKTSTNAAMKTTTVTRKTSSSTPYPGICSIINLMADESYFTIWSSPKLNPRQIKAIRYIPLTFNKPLVLDNGDYSIEVTAPVAESFTITSLGIYVTKELENKNVDSILSNLNVVVTRMLTNYCQIIYMSPILKISKRQTVRTLRDILKKKVSNVHQVIITFKVIKKVHMKIKMLGCKESRKKIINTHYKRKCRRNMFDVLEKVGLSANPPMKEEKVRQLRLSSKTGQGGVLFRKGRVYSLSLKLSKDDTRRSKFTEIGIILDKTSKQYMVTKIFAHLLLLVEKEQLISPKTYKRTRLTFKVPANARIKDLSDMLLKSEKGIRKITFKMTPKRNIKLRLNVKGCVTIPTLSPGLTTVPFGEVKDQGFGCQKAYNIIKDEQNVLIKSTPAMKVQEIKALRFNSKNTKGGAFLKRGKHSFEMSSATGKVMTIVQLGIVLVNERSVLRASRILSNLKVITTRSRISFGKVLFIDQPLSIPKDLKVKDLPRLLKADLLNQVKVTIEFVLLKDVKASIVLKGCQRMMIPKSTLAPGLTTVPFSEVKDQGFGCQKMYNIIKDEQNVFITSTPPLKVQEIKSLRFKAKNPTVGTVLKRGKYSFQFSLSPGKTMTIVQFGIVFINQKSSLSTERILTNLKVVMTRSRISFGKVLFIDQVLNIPGNMKVSDLANILKVQIVSLSKVTVEFTILKDVKAAIRMNGCIPLAGITTPAPLPTPPNTGIVNNQNYKCTTSVDLLPFEDLLSILMVPNVTDHNLLKLRSKQSRYNRGADLLAASYTLEVNLPMYQGATITQFGFDLPLENQKLSSKPLISLLSLELTRIRISFGKIVSTPIRVALPKAPKIFDLRNLFPEQYTTVNRLVIRFHLTRKTNVRLILKGCYAASPLLLTTQKPVGCVHLNKFYAPNEFVSFTPKCEYKICSDGDVKPVIICDKKWTTWKKCSKLCGAGQSSRQQHCTINPQLKGVNKKTLLQKLDGSCLHKIEIKPCFEKLCEVSCKYSTWSSWSPCNNDTCNEQYQTRKREEVINPKYTRCTEPLIESRRCIKPNCSCVENAEMSDCANLICPTDCDHMNDRVKCVTAKGACVKACTCKMGYLYQYGKCIPRSSCECLKPIFKGWLLTTTSSVTRLSGKDGTKKLGQDGGRNPNEEGKSGGTVSTGQPGMSTKKSLLEIKPIDKNDLANMIKSQGATPPWPPGTTPRPLYLASPAWFPGTTDPGATIKLPTEPSGHKRVTPPKGLTAAPPDSLLNERQKWKFYITTRVMFTGENQNVQQKNVPPGPIVPEVPAGSGNIGSKTSPTGNNQQTKSSNQPLTINPQSGNLPSGKSQSSLQPIPGAPPITSSPSSSTDHLKANSTIIVDCRTCICTDGQLVCSGPQCQAGNNTWSRWSEWSPCTSTCRSGIRRRFRQCLGFGCKHKSSPEPGIRRFVAAIGVEAEDKECFVKGCSCVYSKELFKIFFGKYNRDVNLGVAWTEKDAVKGLSSPEEVVAPGDIFRSGETVYVKGGHCKCENGQISCLVD